MRLRRFSRVGKDEAVDNAIRTIISFGGLSPATSAVSCQQRPKPTVGLVYYCQRGDVVRDVIWLGVEGMGMIVVRGLLLVQ